MDAQVIAAFLTGGLGIVAAIVTGLFGLNWKRREINAREGERVALDAKKKTEQALSKGIAVEAAYSVNRLEILTRFNDDGSASQEKRWIGLRCNQHIQNLQIPFEHIVGGYGGRVTGFTGGELKGSTMPVVVRKQQTTDQGSIGTMLISGQCGPETGNISFYIKHESQNAFCLSREQVMKAYAGEDWKQEYVASYVHYPIDMIVLEITFPASHHGLRPEPNPVVFISGTEVVHGSETARLNDSMTFEHGKAQLEVPEPRIGLAYAITWMPPSTQATV